jgi:hypothetical protein
MNIHQFFAAQWPLAAELIKISRGRALVLLATHKALRAFSEAAFSMLVPGYPVKYQGHDGTPAQLTQWLRDTPGGVVEYERVPCRRCNA